MQNEIIFEARHMHKEFGPTIALKDVDIQIRRGEIRGLVGENGSGKSTIMSIAAGMQPSTSGEMVYKGEKWEPTGVNTITYNHLGSRNIALKTIDYHIFKSPWVMLSALVIEIIVVTYQIYF